MSAIWVDSNGHALTEVLKSEAGPGGFPPLAYWSALDEKWLSLSGYCAICRDRRAAFQMEINLGTITPAP